MVPRSESRRWRPSGYRCMVLSRDFLELLSLLNETRAEALVVGGYAVAFHGAPRATGDIDIWVRPTPENAERVLEALRAFGFAFQIIDPRGDMGKMGSMSDTSRSVRKIMISLFGVAGLLWSGAAHAKDFPHPEGKVLTRAEAEKLPE